MISTDYGDAILEALRGATVCLLSGDREVTSRVRARFAPPVAGATHNSEPVEFAPFHTPTSVDGFRLHSRGRELLCGEMGPFDLQVGDGPVFDPGRLTVTVDG